MTATETKARKQAKPILNTCGTPCRENKGAVTKKAVRRTNINRKAGRSLSHSISITHLSYNKMQVFPQLIGKI
ncbi:hypothetical protein GCM10010965_03290 [Caldalkalibacillus thermarum]|nr:hypothetical protein GCM10010965_03290 [Caldalkalibacillus thermarum]